MGGEWRETTLGRICELRAGSVFPPLMQGKRLGEYPFVKVSDMNRATNAHRIQDAANWIDGLELGQLKVKPFPTGTTVFAKIGEALRANRLRYVVRPTVIDNNMMGAVPVTEAADPRFFYYALSQFDFGALASGTALPYLTVGRLSQLKMSLPTLVEQRAIASILGALDDKIDLNRRMSETLEAMARALFKSWFEESDASSSKAAELVLEGILEIGDGYRAKNSELGPPGLRFVRAGDLDGGFHLAGADVLSEASVAKAGSKIGRPGDVAFTSKGTIGRFARVDSRTPRFVYSPQVCYWRSLNPERLHPAILYCWMVGDGFRSQIDAVAGQTDMALYVSLRDQRQMEVPVFAPDQTTVGDHIEAFLERQASLTHESNTLAALRDTLLPKLISGELRIPDAERIVGEVA